MKDDCQSGVVVPVVAPHPHVVYEQTYLVCSVAQAVNEVLPEIRLTIHKAFMECADVDAEIVFRLRRRLP